MFDVPPPHRGARGLEEYRDTWPGFFDWQRSGALFEIVELEVTAGHDVAFAYALLRCGKPTEQDPVVDPRLRLTLGLRREGDQWVVAHEHHSFADTSVPRKPRSHGDIRAGGQGVNPPRTAQSEAHKDAAPSNPA